MKDQILILKEKQESLKSEIENIKTKAPQYIIGLILFAIVGLYAFKDKIYPYFNDFINFIILTSIIVVVICLVYIYCVFIKIKNKEKEIKTIKKKLYKIMKL